MKDFSEENEPFIIERIFNAPVSVVWKAISDMNELKEWYFNLAEFNPVVGFEFEFSAGTAEKIYLHRCKITEVVANKKLTYSWRYEGYDGNSFVTFELSEGENNTGLKLTHHGLETFPKSNADLAKENFAAGWTAIIGTALKQFVEKKSATKHHQEPIT